VRRELIRLHLIARAVAPFLPARMVTALQRVRSLVSGSVAWQRFKGVSAASRHGIDAAVVQVFDAEFYSAMHGASMRGRSPLDHYLDVGWRRRHDPSPLFSAGWYLDHFTAEGHAPVEPLSHYMSIGWREGRDPSPWFSTHWYVGVNSDIGPDMNPLLHYVEHGHREGRTVSESHAAALIRRERQGPAGPVGIGFADLRLLDEDDGGVAVLPRTVSLEGHDLVSFDVWDTLIMRDRPADTAKVATARRMAIAAKMPSETWRLFEARVEVEARMAGEVDHEEYALPEVLARTLAECGLSIDEEVASPNLLAEAELQDEIVGTVVVPEAMEMLRRVSANPRVTVLALSDFYIGNDGMSRLLSHHGIDTERVHVIISVDEGASKRLGTMFEVVQQRFGVAGGRHLHIGDNPIVDGALAKATGADAIVVTPRDRGMPGPGALDRDWYIDAVRSLEDELDEVAATMVGRSSSTISQRTAFAAGVRSAALVVPHISAAIERAIELDEDTVFYMSREGASAAEIHGLVAKQMFGSQAPRCVHLEVSRRSTFGPSLTSLDDASLGRMWRQYSAQSPAGLLASLGLEPARFDDQLRKAGLAPDASIEGIRSNLRVREFLDRPDVSASITATLTTQREALLRYLADREFVRPRRVVVDVGWRGTIQDNLCHLLPDTELHGVYLGLFPFYNPQPVNATKRAVIFDGNRGEPFDHVEPPAALEGPLTPPICTTVGYANVDGRIDAVLQEEVGRADDLVAAFQEGLRFGAPTAARRYTAWGATSDLLRAGLQDALARYFRDPPPGVADIWFFSSHDDTFGAMNVTPFDKSRPDLSLTYGDTPPASRLSATASLWPEGWAAWLPVRALDIIRHQRKTLT
jgi:FMN phosphatase YigB (HAD superfamily)